MTRKETDLKNNNPDGGLLTICLLVTLAVAIGAGLLISADSMNPIETLMFFVHDGFTFTADTNPPDIPPGESTEPDFIPPEVSFPESTAVDITDETDTTFAPDTSAVPPETTQTPPETTKRPPETTQTPPETTQRTPETTVSPPETTAPQPDTTTNIMNDEEYFSNTLFLGDSRTVGLALYARIPGATYFARTSMNVSNVFADKPSETSDTASYANLAQLLSQKSFGRIYILLGINEIGYSYSWIVNNYSKTIEYIRMYQPDAKIIIQSNMHVTKKKSDANPNTFSNARIDELNKRLSGLADGRSVYYLSFERIFDGEDGAMSSSYSGDGVHLYGKCYKLWRDWICENGKIF